MRLDLWGIKFATLALAAACGCVHGQQMHNITVYYFPLGAETLTPITSTNIQERGRHCEIHSPKHVDKIKNVLHSTPKPASRKFSDQAVRVKLLESNGGERLLAIIDNDGSVRLSDGTEGSISRKDLETIKGIMESHCR